MNEWYNFVVTFDELGHIRIYKNGVSVEVEGDQTGKNPILNLERTKCMIGSKYNVDFDI